MTPPKPDITRPDRDLLKAHVLVQGRWPVLNLELRQAGYLMFVNEVYRPDLRQQWLFGAGRTPEQCAKKGVPKGYARPTESIVTNSWSSRNSAHGWTETVNGMLVPAAAALDVVPLGRDGKPWTKDDPWEEFVTFIKAHEHLGLRHFAKPGKRPWDKPHLQLVEWSDAEKRVILPGG